MITRTAKAGSGHRIWLSLLMTSTIIGYDAVIPSEAFAQTSLATTRSHTFSIPAQPLRASLNAFIRQTGWQVGFAPAAVSGKQANAVTGAMTPAQALQAMLAGTGLEPRQTGATTAAIVASSAQASLNAMGRSAGDGVALDTLEVSGFASSYGNPTEFVVSQKDLERLNPSDLKGVFAGQPGVSVGSSIPMSQKLYVNGVEENNLAVSIDGSRQNNKVFHHNGTTLIDPTLLKAVRVDPGLAPADAGPGALGGAIAFQTKDARDFLATDGVGGTVKSVFNTNGNISTTGVTGYTRSKGFEALGSFTYGTGGEFEAGNGQTVGGTSTNLLSGIGKIGYEAESGDRFQISHERLRDEAPRPFRANLGSLSNRRPWEPLVRDYRMERENTVFTYTNTKPSGWWDPKAVLAYSRAQVTTPIYEPAAVYPGSGATDSFNGKLENRFAVLGGSVNAGLDFYRDKGSYRDRNLNMDERANNVGLYSQARLQPWERVRVSMGMRVDRQEFIGTTGESWDNSGLSRNISGELDIVPEFLTAKAGYAHVWGGIPLAENFIMNPAWRYGSGPQVTTSDNATGGLVARYGGFTAEASVFRTDIDNARAARFAVGSAALTRDVRSEGYELSLAYNWADGFARVRYIDLDVKIDGQYADSDAGTYLVMPVKKAAVFTVVHAFRNWGVSVGADLEVVLPDNRVIAGSPSYKGYELFNAFVEYIPPTLQHLTFRADVRNLLNQTYADRATYGTEFGNVTPLYQPGRAFLISAIARF